MIIHVFDPGIQTGFVAYDSKKVSIVSQTMRVTEFEKILGLPRPDVIIIERLPPQPASDLVEIINICKEYCRMMGKIPVYINPGTWKPVAKAQNWKIPTLHSQHERDAFRILQYFIWIHFDDLFKLAQEGK